MPPPTLASIGTGLQRPECVLATSRGRLFVSDRRGGVLAIDPDGTQTLIGSSSMMPNGIALLRDGSFLIANLAPEGGVWQLSREGQVTPWLTEVDRVPLPRVNFVAIDDRDRAWVCISATEGGDRYPIDSRSGYIVLRDAAGTRVVADGLRYTNECRVSADGRTLYVNETFARCLTRFRIAPDGTLHDRSIVAEFDAGDFPDGMALDADGGVFIVCVVSNRVYRVTPDGARRTILDDADPACVEPLERAYQARTLTRPQLSAARGRRLRNITSIAFGGADLRTAYLGCLEGDALAVFRSPVAGLPPVHWDWG